LALADSERSYREVFDGTGEAMLIQDAETGGMVDANQAWLSLFGCTREEAFQLGPDDLSLGSPPYDAEAVAERTRRAVREGKQTFDWLSRRRGGELFWSEVSLQAACIGGQTRVLAVVRDIDARRRAEDQLKEALREKALLLREIHHRVKNNLQVISSLFDLETTVVTSPDAVAMLRENRQRVVAMAAVHERLYAAGSQARLLVGEYLDELIPAVVRAYRPDGGIEVQVSSPGVDLSANCAVPFALIVNELVSNSLEHGFGTTQRGRIGIAVRRTAEGQVSLVAEDDGRGLPPGFDLDRDASLGLTIVKVLARQLGGSIRVERGVRAAFHLAFPDQRGGLGT
jgi:PAS domain S-box-containing protein